MRLVETSLLYGTIGLAIGISLVRFQVQATITQRALHFVTSTLLWPLFVPVLLNHFSQEESSEFVGESLHVSLLDPKLRAASHELWNALTQLHGVAEEILTPERDRILHVFSDLAKMESRLQEMKQVLQQPGFQLSLVQAELDELQQEGCGVEDPRWQSLQRRKHNIQTLQHLQERTSAELERAQQKMVEVSTQLTLLRFVEHSDVEAVTQLKQLTSSVETVTESLTLLSQSSPTYNLSQSTTEVQS